MSSKPGRRLFRAIHGPTFSSALESLPQGYASCDRLEDVNDCVQPVGLLVTGNIAPCKEPYNHGHSHQTQGGGQYDGRQIVTVGEDQIPNQKRLQKGLTLGKSHGMDSPSRRVTYLGDDDAGGNVDTC
jgi:hypothetical protein